MSVRVEKQEFGLREKLNELEFDKLPYHKMPVGTILQVRQSHNTTNTTISSGSYTNLRQLTIHPISRNSLMYIRTNCQPRCFVSGNNRARFYTRITREDTDKHLNGEMLILTVVLLRYVEVQLLLNFVIGIVKLNPYFINFKSQDKITILIWVVINTQFKSWR